MSPRRAFSRLSLPKKPIQSSTVVNGSYVVGNDSYVVVNGSYAIGNDSYVVVNGSYVVVYDPTKRIFLVASF